MSFLSTRLSPTAKTWNRGSTGKCPFWWPPEKMEKLEIPRAEKRERVERLFFLHFRPPPRLGRRRRAMKKRARVDIRARPRECTSHEQDPTRFSHPQHNLSRADSSFLPIAHAKA
ncbi:hypothetical protein NL676_000437 [Syzygium grande]|nr:hypothetical protein NL676_000437 [Syzygium grande]